MRIVFIGSVESSRRSLECLLQMRADAVGVRTLRSSAFNAGFCDLTPTCHGHDIPCTCVGDINSPQTIAWIAEKSLEIMATYRSELQAFPLPRSNEAIRALAQLRGAASGFIAAEAFELLRERV